MHGVRLAWFQNDTRVRVMRLRLPLPGRRSWEVVNLRRPLNDGAPRSLGWELDNAAREQLSTSSNGFMYLIPAQFSFLGQNSRSMASFFEKWTSFPNPTTIYWANNPVNKRVLFLHSDKRNSFVKLDRKVHSFLGCADQISFLESALSCCTECAWIHTKNMSQAKREKAFFPQLQRHYYAFVLLRWRLLLCPKKLWALFSRYS